MDELFNAFFGFPGVILTVMMGVVTLYWCMVVFGIFDIDFGGGVDGVAEGAAEGAAEAAMEGAAEAAMEGAAEAAVEGAAEAAVEGAAEAALEGVAEGAAEAALEGVAEGAAEAALEGVAEGAAEAALEGVAEGAAEAAMEGVAEGAAEAAADGVAEGLADAALEGAADGVADGVAEGAADGATEGASSSLVASMLAVLKLRSAPATVIGSFIIFYTWLLCILQMTFVAPPVYEWIQIPLWLTGIVAIVLAFVVALPMTSLSARPLARFFVIHQAPGRGSLLGKVCEVSTGRVDGRFGQAKLTEGGDVMLLQVRCDGAKSLKRGQQALIVSYDLERQAFVVEPYDEIVRRGK